MKKRLYRLSYLPTQFREKEIRIKKVKCPAQYVRPVSSKTQSGIDLLIPGLVHYSLLHEQKDRGHFYAEKDKWAVSLQKCSAWFAAICLKAQSGLPGIETVELHVDGPCGQGKENLSFRGFGYIHSVLWDIQNIYDKTKSQELRTFCGLTLTSGFVRY